jgi:CubicO group peptidase (beta-lactamase class C family)
MRLWASTLAAGLTCVAGASALAWAGGATPPPTAAAPAPAPRPDVATPPGAPSAPSADAAPDATSAPAPLPALSDADAAALGAHLQSVIERDTLGAFWGAVLVQHRGHTLVRRGWGLANEAGRPIGTDTLLDIGSVSKMFTAAAVLALQDDGKLSIDDPIGKHVAYLGERGKAITLRHLLTHTAGLDDTRALQRLNYPDPDEAVALAIEAEPVAPPGEDFRYSNAGYVVLAAIVQRVAKQDFQRFVVERVFRPAGMKDTGFIGGLGLPEGSADRQATRDILRTERTPAARARLVDPRREPFGWGLIGAGGVASTLDDLAAWDAALREGRMLSRAALDAMLAPGMPEVAPGYGLGWQLERTPAGGPVQSHGGNTRGFNAYLQRRPDTGTLIVVLTNQGFDADRVANLVRRELFPEERLDIRAQVDISGLTRNEHGLVRLPRTALAWRVERAEDSAQVRLVLAPRPGAPGDAAEPPRAVLTMTPMRAAMIAGQLEHVLYDPDRAEHDADAPSIGVMLATLGYDATDGRFGIESVLLSVMPSYRGLDDERNVITDPRVTLAVVDTEAGMWPVITPLSDEEAAALANALRGG